jgi:spore photoproduct lyase
MDFKTVFYEPGIVEYELGQKLMNQYAGATWVQIDNHNNIEQLRKNPNTEFAAMKRFLIIGTRKTHVYRKNEKVSDFLVPFTSSGCTATCLYCYLVCNYNKCSYLRLFVNREQMLAKLIKTAKQSSTDLTFEIGSNSDLVLENTITGNLEWAIPKFGKQAKGFLTFPTKFSMVEPLLSLEHRGRTIVRVSVNPQEIITDIERGTSNLMGRINGLNKLCDAGYKVGLLIAPVVLVENWKPLYKNLIRQLADSLNNKVKQEMVIEIIFMTYSYIHRAINNEAFPEAIELYDKSIMTGRGRGKYTYSRSARADGEMFLRQEIRKHFSEDKILYIV